MTDPHIEVPAWWSAPAPPDWVLEQLDAPVTSWRPLGARRWHGQLVGDLIGPDLLLVADDREAGFMRYALCLDAEPDRDWIIERIFADLQAEIDRRHLPECAKPGCSDKAPTTFTAAEPGPLAGRQREPGEQIHFCPRHGHDVWVAASGGPVVDWLKPDAVRLDPIEAMWAAGFANDSQAYDEAVDRLRKLTTFTREPET